MEGPPKSSTEARAASQATDADEEPVPKCLMDMGSSRETGVMFLGTGSAEPSKYRGPSAILLSTPGPAYMLLDCGEGTWGQILRKFGPAGAANVVSRSFFSRFILNLILHYFRPRSSR